MIGMDWSNTRIYIKPGRTDMRKSINGLSVIVQENFKKDPLSGNLFVFCNRKKDIIKILYWDRNGFCIWQKRLEKDRFPWPVSKEEVSELNTQQFGWLLNGVDFRKMHKNLHYKSVM